MTDFKRIGPKPHQPGPRRPQCEATRHTRYWSDGPETDMRCTFQASYVINGKHLCSRHAGQAALKILENRASQEGTRENDKTQS